MKKLMNIKVGIALLAATVALVAAVAAYAYFTGGTGSGTGNAGVGTSTNNIVLSSGAVTGLLPGGPDVPVAVTVHNPAGNGSQYVGTISGTVANGGVGGACLGSWFVVDPITYNAALADGATDSASLSLTTAVRMLDPGINQDVCKNVTMTINWVSN
jgi:hypothetical protein